MFQRFGPECRIDHIGGIRALDPPLNRNQKQEKVNMFQKVTRSREPLSGGLARTLAMIAMTAVVTLSAVAASAQTVTVHQNNYQQWFFYNDETDVIDNSLGSFVNGPGSPLVGNGGVQISVTGTQRRNIATYRFAGTPLASITDLAFSTYNPSAGNGGSVNRSAYLNFNVDFDGSDTWQKRLIFVPSQNGTVIQDTWQEWDAINSGNAMWAYSGPTWPAGVGGGGEAGSTLKTWNQILSQYPGVRIRVSDGWLGLRVGEPYVSGYTENIDYFKFGTGSPVTFDFELSPSLVVDDDGMGVEGNCDDATAASSTIAAAVTAASPGDTIFICPGTYPLSSTVAVNKEGLALVGTGGSRPVIQVPTSTGYAFTVSGANVTMDNLEIQKTDLGTPHNLNLVTGTNFVAQNNLIYGPDPGGTWNSTGYVSRAFEVSAGLSGLLFLNNEVHTLRQPAYINASSGTAIGNSVSGTKGWVIDGGNIQFLNNTFGEPQNQDCDIALLPSVNPANYPDLIALSNLNDNAFICAQYVGGENGRSTAYVDVSAGAGGNGSNTENYQSIQNGIDGALAGGTVQVASGTYIEELLIDKPLTVLGANAGVDPNNAVRGAESVIMPSVSDPTYTTGTEMVIIGAENVTFDGFTVDGDNPSLNSGVVFNGADVDAGYGIDGPGSSNPRVTVQNNIVRNIGEFGIFFYGSNAANAVNSTVKNNLVDNIPGQVFGQGIHIRDNAYANVTDNVLTRVGLGVVIENFSQVGASPASISNNQIQAHIYAIRHNLHYNYSTNGFTISNNTITSYVETFARATPITRFNGIRIESIQGSVPATFQNNAITPNRSALVGAGYTRVDGIFITNTSTVSPNILITGKHYQQCVAGYFAYYPRSADHYVQLHYQQRYRCLCRYGYPVRRH